MTVSYVCNDYFIVSFLIHVFFFLLKKKKERNAFQEKFGEPTQWT